MTPLELIQAIARGVEVGHSGRVRIIRWQETINRCREMCDRHGISYAPSDIQPTRTDSPISRVAARKKGGGGVKRRWRHERLSSVSKKVADAKTAAAPQVAPPATATAPARAARPRVARQRDRNAGSGKTETKS